jgi:cyclopropane-fatty-acyl-phospholipid synthase
MSQRPGGEGTAGASAAAIRQHYDLSNQFYAAWLDASMTYSAALVLDDDQTLEEAQRSKLEHFLDAVSPPRGGRLLDIGCGWGSLLHLAAERGIGRAVGLTLSEAQVDHVRQSGADDRVAVELSGWEDHDPVAGYDGIVSIGAFEHFAGPGSTTEDRITRYTAFFSRCAGWLDAGGRLGLQTIALDAAVENPDSPVGRFFTDDIFPESSVPRLGEIVPAFEPWFRLDELRVDGAHYAWTCRQWRERLTVNADAAAHAATTEAVRRYRKFLLLSELQFATGAATLYRFVLTRRTADLTPSRAADERPTTGMTT